MDPNKCDFQFTRNTAEQLGQVLPDICVLLFWRQMEVLFEVSSFAIVIVL